MLDTTSPLGVTTSTVRTSLVVRSSELSAEGITELLGHEPTRVGHRGDPVSVHHPDGPRRNEDQWAWEIGISEGDQLTEHLARVVAILAGKDTDAIRLTVLTSLTGAGDASGFSASAAVLRRLAECSADLLVDFYPPTRTGGPDESWSQTRHYLILRFEQFAAEPAEQGVSLRLTAVPAVAPPRAEVRLLSGVKEAAGTDEHIADLLRLVPETQTFGSALLITHSSADGQGGMVLSRESLASLAAHDVDLHIELRAV